MGVCVCLGEMIPVISILMLAASSGKRLCVRLVSVCWFICLSLSLSRRSIAGFPGLFTDTSELTRF